VAGSGASEMRRQVSLIRRSKPHSVPARRPRVNRPRDGVVLHPVTDRSDDLGQQRWISGMPIREERQGRLKGKSTGGDAEQTYKHRARDAEGLADLRLYQLQHASMLRGVEARGSEHF